MRVIARAGTPHHPETKACTSSNDTKKFLLGRVDRRMKWANAYNQALYAELSAIREQIDRCPVNALKTGDVRSWEARDDHTGVTFVFEIIKEQS